MKEHLIYFIISSQCLKSRPGCMANGETQGNQCQTRFEGKWFVRRLASTKLQHRFPFIYCLSVLVCGYMWVQTGYFEIMNLGVDNNLKTKVERRLHLGEGRGKKDVLSAAESMGWASEVADTAFSWQVLTDLWSWGTMSPPTGKGDLGSDLNWASVRPPGSLGSCLPIPQPCLPLLIPHLSHHQHLALWAYVGSWRSPLWRGIFLIGKITPSLPVFWFTSLTERAISWSSCFGAKLLRHLSSIFSMLISLPPGLEYYDYSKCSWTALLAEYLCTLVLKRLPKSISKLFVRAARVSPYAWACTQPVQTQPGGWALSLGLLIPTTWLGVPYSKTRAVSAPGEAAEDRGWLARLELTSRGEMFPSWTTKRVELKISVCVLWKMLGICYLLPCYLAQDCLRCYEVGWAGLSQSLFGWRLVRDRVSARSGFSLDGALSWAITACDPSSWGELPTGNFQVICLISPSYRGGREGNEMYFQCPCSHVPLPVGAT